jgi:hypothetical protein
MTDKDRPMTSDSGTVRGRATDGWFKFERLEVLELSLEYLDLCYAMAERLPRQKENSRSAVGSQQSAVGGRRSAVN